MGGAIYSSDPLTVTNTIVANSPSGGNCASYSTTIITDGGHNIDDDGSCGFSGTSLKTNPMLDPAGLADNGGPTQTIALQASSPAINAGDESVCAAPPVNNLDQRGYARPGAGATRCSIGAYEYNAVPAGPTPTPTTATAPETPTTTPTATPGPLVVNGTCMEPGSQGLVPCAAGTVVTAYLCTDPSCATLTILEVTQTDASGRFVFVLDGAQVAGKRLVFDATIVPGASAQARWGRQAAGSTAVDYRIIDFGPAGVEASLSELIGPASEAAMRLLEENGGAQNYSDQGIKDVIQAVQTAVADSGINFASLTPADAATLATDTARTDLMVQQALQMQLCPGDCGGDGAVTVNEIITLVNIALGSAPPAACPNGIPSGASVDITLIIKAVGFALGSCPGA
jgi:hypothetical protein